MAIRIIRHANIYTFDPHHPKVSTLAMEGDRIIAAGDDGTIMGDFPRCKDIFDAGGSIIIPGLIDGHIHLQKYALSLTYVGCETPTQRECLQNVADRAQKIPPGTWIIGHGWNQNDWPEGFGHASQLDLIAPQHRVYLTAKSLHAAWVNSTALRLAGIDSQTPDPPGGKIGRDDQGNPTGILFESAMELVAQWIEEPDPFELYQPMASALSNLAAFGLTGMHDFDQRNCFAALQLLHQQGELRLRVVKSIPVDDLSHAVAIGLRSGFGDLTLRIGGVKAFADGALGPRTAAMLQPYDGEPDNQGILMLDAEELVEIGQKAVKNGLSLAVHAIGDRANHQVLNAIAELRTHDKSVSPHFGDQRLRHRIEHVQLIHPEDAGRLAELGVVASMQPIHAPSDMNMANQYWGARSAFAYAWRTQLRHGAVLAFGSDAPVESPNPFWGIHAAVTRSRLDGSPGAEGWYPQQRLTPAEAIQAYTFGPAYAASLETQVGKISPGYLADLVVLDTDPLTCDPEALHSIRPHATMVGGEWVYLA